MDGVLGQASRRRGGSGPSSGVGKPLGAAGCRVPGTSGVGAAGPSRGNFPRQWAVFPLRRQVAEFPGREREKEFLGREGEGGKFPGGRTNEAKKFSGRDRVREVERALGTGAGGGRPLPAAHHDVWSPQGWRKGLRPKAQAA